jgi:hypothetical protein
MAARAPESIRPPARSCSSASPLAAAEHRRLGITTATPCRVSPVRDRLAGRRRYLGRRRVRVLGPRRVRRIAVILPREHLELVSIEGAVETPASRVPGEFALKHETHPQSTRRG